jgi:hypothetical protein
MAHTGAPSDAISLTVIGEHGEELPRPATH